MYEEAPTPNSSSEGNENAERLRVVLRARVRLDAFQYADHNRQNYYFARGAYRERHVRYTVPRNGLEVCVFLRPKRQSSLFLRIG